ncbi:hypothetical protein J4G48_0040045 [Bradyrhizobium barranii subsp. apii]|uniref:hypothetical protein n=1 Tax=Bradyrhizobium barranii TaxID=2992140 RepID=UPI001AA1C584|nr:hypothetical protein [Bradyrhizobium barranii]UPT95351.1 hypothetical protein J4G48_0040045 [Bradyrhizobium barranii subsp. apii]
MRLDEWPLPYVRVKCDKCDREGKLSRVGLIDRFGPERDLFTVREKLTEPTCKRPDKKQPCMSILTDALLVQAILADTEADVIEPKLLPEAIEWRQTLGLEK